MKHLLSFLLFLTTFSFTSAQSNHSLSFDGVDDYVSISNNIASIYNEFTISSWVKVSNYGDPNPDFILDVGTSGEGTRKL